MWICRTVGMVISTIKEQSLRSNKLLLVRRASAEGEASGEVFVALDTVGAGEDELVLVALGSSARESEKTRGTPVDAAIIGIIDSTAGSGQSMFCKSQEKPRRG